MSWSNEIEKLYVICHNVKEKERYDRLIVHLKEIGIPDDVVLFMAPVWSDELTNELIFNVYDPFLPRPVPGLTFNKRGNIIRIKLLCVCA